MQMKDFYFFILITNIENVSLNPEYKIEIL